MSSAEDAYRQHRSRIYRFFRSRLQSDDDAEDLTQRVFLDAVIALSEGRNPPDSIVGWLYAVAQRRLVDELRRRSRTAGHSAAWEPSTEAMTYGPSVAAALDAAIAALPESQRSVVVLRLLRGLSFGEISAELNTSEAAVKMRFARGIETVRQQLIDQGLDTRSG
ncbi:MAG: RNA polymerase sigma factor [Thermoleophilia bacterium]|nr:RNA polymerase sigma factor [Thermoleophilia bacterium]